MGSYFFWLRQAVLLGQAFARGSGEHSVPEIGAALVGRALSAVRRPYFLKVGPRNRFRLPCFLEGGVLRRAWPLDVKGSPTSWKSGATTGLAP